MENLSPALSKGGMVSMATLIARKLEPLIIQSDIRISHTFDCWFKVNNLLGICSELKLFPVLLRIVLLQRHHRSQGCPGVLILATSPNSMVRPRMVADILVAATKRAVKRLLRRKENPRFALSPEVLSSLRDRPSSTPVSLIQRMVWYETDARRNNLDCPNDIEACDTSLCR